MSEIAHPIPVDTVEPTGVVLLGGGGHGDRSHGKLFMRLGDLGRLVAIAEPNPERRAALRAMPEYEGVQISAEWQKVINLEGVDAAIVASPDDSHFEQAAYAIEQAQHGQGISVLLEKPVVNTTQEATILPNLMVAAQNKGLTLMPCLPREFGEPWSTLKTLVNDRETLSQRFGVGDLGKILGITFTCNYTAANPNKLGLHTSLAKDKSAHDINSAVGLAGIKHFEQATLKLNKADRFTMNLIGITGNGDEVEIASRGSRTIPRDFYSKNFPSREDQGIYRDTVQVDFEQGMIRVDPHLGRIAVTWGALERNGTDKDWMTDYNKQFLALNRHFLLCTRGGAEPLITEQGMLLSALTIIELEAAGGLTEVRV